jgi:cytochrome c biogenesis protein CcmG/thiol:disulfide interchange protein DsbE
MLESWMVNRGRWLALTAALAVAGALWIWVSAAPAAATTGGRIPSPRQGFLAPQFSLDQLDGVALDLSRLRGQVVIVNFWASWCPPCRAEMPDLQGTYQAYRDQGLEILAVNATSQDSEAAARAFADDYALTFPVLLDRSGLVANLYQTRALPSTFFIDRHGVIQQVIVGGPMNAATLQTTVQSLLESDD